MRKKTIVGLILIVTIALVVTFTGCIDKKESELNIGDVTTTWNLSFLFSSREEALAEFEEVKLRSEYINETYRPKFDALTGTVLLDYLEDEKKLLESLDVLWIYAYAQNSLNVNDEFFESFLSDIQDLYTEHEKATSFVTLKLTAISKPEWDKIFDEEPGLNEYKPFLESTYVRFVDHRPQNESHAAFLASISNQRMKLEINALKEITNNVTVAGNITLDNGEKYTINSQSYYSLLSTDINRDNRKKCYDKRFYHLVNESDEMAKLYCEKIALDDLYARELNYPVVS